ncbi:MAG: Ribosomal protein S18 [uncultured bacterium]|uniref:30S ribosomal protein S18 n=2 Tax=Candidatus Daviesiibacteriota TaxID=1752718 RepID=A0A1F5K4U2_9BACT|nr:MAG: Ribosomal protein S18 [uncultured bacterium]OGE17118.1 MAG: 30S ribosomal protein S18 [Candidatus Daviesbacteria bacterium RIFCSPHIGHO2_01_FULL_36_37]OGE35899.1 MAG: 30S ribosomal protein S18 [Candidatus Daviesbacteria bacterium RIFCSPHIGHO2_12_FULL_37_16]
MATKKVCHFCENSLEPSYTDSSALRKFMNDRARISSRLRSGVCSKHQRALSREIKHARHLAILPFVPRI